MTIFRDTDRNRVNRPRSGRTGRFIFTAAIGFCCLGWAGGAMAEPGDLAPDCDPDALPSPLDQKCIDVRLEEGRRLFDEETFGGNGRTCLTCHSRKTGTLSKDDVQKRLSQDPFDPLFLHDGLDDDLVGTDRIEDFATIRVTLPLPFTLMLADDPGATEVSMNRGIPTTRNVPALDNAFMHDFRNPDLMSQALGAINGHAQNLYEPTPLELELIAEFQRSDARFFSDGRLKKWARTGIPPALPEGVTESEKRGRAFFVDAPFNPPSKDGLCALCHSGPLLDRSNIHALPVLLAPPGSRPFSIGVSERNLAGNPEHTLLVNDFQTNPDGTPKPPVEVTTPDIGILMTDPWLLAGQGIIPPLPVLPFLNMGQGIRLAYFANKFKTPTLWGVTKTAPYFHDNSAADLDEMLEQYDWFFAHPDFEFKGSVELTEQDKEDIKAFLELL